MMPFNTKPAHGALQPLQIVILGLSITSSWGNGHATTYRGLVRALDQRGHDVLFLERDVPWYEHNRDMPKPPFGRLALYPDLAELKHCYEEAIREADLVIVGSYVPEGVAVGDWVIQTARGMVAFYDIDTPVTLAKLRRGDFEYLEPRQIADYDLYLSFAGGPILDHLEREYASPAARPFYCSVDPMLYYPENRVPEWDLGYMGTYSPDRQPGLERLLLEPASNDPVLRFVVAGPGFPDSVQWPANVERIEHVPPDRHRSFYNSQRHTLNLTRADMVEMGYSPSVRLFEAAACGTLIISDYWEGLETFFALNHELLVARSAQDMLGYLHDLDEHQRNEMRQRAYETVLRHHTAEHRALQLESYFHQLQSGLQRMPASYGAVSPATSAT
jgi:spore maturation protein CgeB